MMTQNHHDIYFQNSSDYSDFPTSGGDHVNICDNDSSYESTDDIGISRINTADIRGGCRRDYEFLRARHRVRGGIFNSIRRSITSRFWDEDSLRSSLAITGTRYLQKIRAEEIVRRLRCQRRCGIALLLMNIILIAAIVIYAVLNKLDENVLESVLCMKCKRLDNMFGNLAKIKEVAVGSPWGDRCCFDNVEKLLGVLNEKMDRNKADTEKSTDFAIKEAFSKMLKHSSSAQRSLGNPTARVVGITSTGRRRGRGDMMWSADSKNAFVRNGIELGCSNISLLAPEAGHYLLYSQVSFRVEGEPKSSCNFDHRMVRRSNCSASDTLLVSAIHKCESTTWNSFVLSFARLYKDEAVSVEVSNIKHTEKTPSINHFGMVLL